MGSRKPLQPAKRRPIFVNGVLCETLTAGAKEASRILGRVVTLWQMQRAANGVKPIPRITVREPPRKPPPELEPEPVQDEDEKRIADAVQRVFRKTKDKADESELPLLRYRYGELPIERGLSHVRR